MSRSDAESRDGQIAAVTATLQSKPSRTSLRSRFASLHAKSLHPPTGASSNGQGGPAFPRSPSIASPTGVRLLRAKSISSWWKRSESPTCPEIQPEPADSRSRSALSLPRASSGWAMSEALFDASPTDLQSSRRRLRKMRKPPEQFNVDDTSARTASESLGEVMGSSLRSRESFVQKDGYGRKGNEDQEEDASFQRTELNPEGAEEGHSFDEGAMDKHFLDIESSFIPDTTAVVTQEAPAGQDDTYLELANPEASPAKAPQPAQNEDSSEGLGSDNAEAFEQYTRDGEARGLEAELESGIQASSSPAAAAASRTHRRSFSLASASKITPVRATPISIATNGRLSATPEGATGQRPDSKTSTIRPVSMPPRAEVEDPHVSFSAVDLSEPDWALSTNANTRPAYANRQPSLRSTVSAVTGTSEVSESDQANDLDFALQTGGSVLQRDPVKKGRTSDFLARLPSFGSVGSTAVMDKLGSVNDRSINSSRITSRATVDNRKEDDRPKTPRARPSNFDMLTDTVIAQHVQNIHVPETIARDFRAMNRSFSPEKRPASSGGFGGALADRPRRTLTLKEQNGKIDKLTKENFDLKLKIHFLDQALQNRSDDGVKELIEKNVQLQTDLANERKETQSLRRKLRALEAKLKEQQDALDDKEQRRGKDRVEEEDPTLQAEMHEEILMLRQQLDHSENQISSLQENLMTKEFERRKLAENLRSLANKRGEQSAETNETADMWQDLLTAETGRREQAEEDASKIRGELNALRLERSTMAPNHTTKLLRRRGRAGSRQSFDEFADVAALEADAAASTAMVEQLKHETAELRRDLGAQTSMLTSRNRERERLQQEIEDLKLLLRKNDGARSLAGESIFDRSVSRAHQHAESLSGERTGSTLVGDAEREEWERKEGLLRDQNAEVRIKYQELERTHSKHIQYVSALEGDFQEMEQELNEFKEDLLKLQSERDEALQAYDEKESELEKLKEEALAEITALDEEKHDLQVQLEDAVDQYQKTQAKLQNTADGYKGLQGELREITHSVMNLEDEKQANMRTIQTLEQQIAETEDEIQKWEQKCRELDQKNKRLEITQESLHSEITFLREEQEGDKIKIGELEDALNGAQQTIQDEQDKLREIEESIVEERQQRDVLENKSKEEVQKILDGLNSDNTKVKDEARKLRRALSTKEVEASGWKQRLEELEQALRDALGDPEGTKPTLLAEIERLQRELESIASELDRAKMEQADKDRLLRHREGLLESTSLESRRLSNLLDKERASRKHDLDQFDKASRGQASHLRTIAQQESRVLELETTSSQERRKMASLQHQYREQLVERNSLLLALWNRLSTLCGNDWAQAHSLINGEVPSVDVIGRQLHAFNKNILAAVKAIESLIGNFKVRIRGIEKTMARDYQALEHQLDQRIRRLEALERVVKESQEAMADEAAHNNTKTSTQISRTMSHRSVVRTNEEMAKLRTEVKNLKTELKFHRMHPSALASQMINNHHAQLNPVEHHARRPSSSSQSGGGGRSQMSPGRIMASFLRRSSASSAMPADPNVHSAEIPPVASSSGSSGNNTLTSKHHRRQLSSSSSQSRPPQPQPPQHSHSQSVSLPPSTSLSITPSSSTPPPASYDTAMQHRMNELERRLQKEREDRKQDRHDARQRLLQGEQQNAQLRSQLEREKLWRDNHVSASETASLVDAGDDLTEPGPLPHR